MCLHDYLKEHVLTPWRSDPLNAHQHPLRGYLDEFLQWLTPVWMWSHNSNDNVCNHLKQYVLPRIARCFEVFSGLEGPPPIKDAFEVINMMYKFFKDRNTLT